MLKTTVVKMLAHTKIQWIRTYLPEAEGGGWVVWMFLSKVTVALFPRCDAVRLAGCWPDRMMFPLDATS